MATHDRPSGLTALAVISLLFSLMDAVGAMKDVGLYLAREHLDTGAQENPYLALPLLTLVAMAGLKFLCSVLLLTSGVGFLKQSRILGRWAGNAYALAGLGLGSVLALWVPHELEGQISIDLVRTLFYPVFIAYLVNSTFRRDLKR